MEQSEKELKLLIERITAEVVSNLIPEPAQKSKAEGLCSPGIKHVLLLVSDKAMGAGGLFKATEKRYNGYAITVAAYRKVAAADFKDMNEILDLNEAVVREKLADTISRFDEICFLCPGLRQMQALLEGDDSGYMEGVVIYSLLHGKKTTIQSDYGAESLPLNNFTRKVKDMLKSVSEMGICVEVLQGEKNNKTGTQVQHKELITQKEVEDTHKTGGKEIFRMKGCIITPLAKDRASELGIKIIDM